MVIAALISLLLKIAPVISFSWFKAISKIHINASPDIECEHGAVQLVGGLTDSTGRLEFCAHGMWGRVCNALGFWGSSNAKVVCHQLGFSREGELNL